MLLRSVFTKTLRDLRWPTFWTALALFVGGGYFTLLYPTYATQFKLTELLDQLPAAMKALIGAQVADVSSATGFLNIELFPMMLPAVLAGFAIAQGSGATAGEESRGTIDVLLSYPVPRWLVVAQKAAAILLAVVVVAAGLWVGAVLGAMASNSPLDSGRVAEALVMAVLLALDFGAVALLLAARTGNRGLAIGVSAALLVVMYFVNALAPVISGLDSVRQASLFFWYLESNPIRHGISLGDSAVLAAVAVALFLASLVAFDRRDLAA